MDALTGTPISNNVPPRRGVCARYPPVDVDGIIAETIDREDFKIQSGWSFISPDPMCVSPWSVALVSFLELKLSNALAGSDLPWFWSGWSATSLSLGCKRVHAGSWVLGQKVTIFEFL